MTPSTGGSWLELAIIAFIVLSIGFHVFRGGQANPESTGQLGNRMRKLENEFRDMGGKLSTLDGRVAEIDRRAATVSDVRRIENTLESHERRFDDLTELMSDMRVGMGEHKATSEHTRRQVDRVYDLIMERGINA